MAPTHALEAEQTLDAVASGVARALNASPLVAWNKTVSLAAYYLRKLGLPALTFSELRFAQESVSHEVAAP
jgi:hypothetical protein